MKIEQLLTGAQRKKQLMHALQGFCWMRVRR
jgi:hypothetical protein